MVNVTSPPYNASPSNTDNGPNIKNAIDAAGVAGGGYVYIPAGIYPVTTPILINYNNIRLVGEGVASVLNCTIAADSPPTFGACFTTASGVSELTIERLKIAGVMVYGIRLIAVARFLI